MLDVMRSNAKSSLIALIFGAIILTFIFSFGRGSSGFRTRTPETWAARVNGELVTASDFAQAYSSRFRQMSAMRGGKYTTDNARQDNLKAETLKSLVDQELIAQQADDLGIRVSDAEVADTIARSPQFQQDGKFDFDYYKRLVENGYGMSIKRFEEAYRRDLLRGKVVQVASVEPEPLAIVYLPSYPVPQSEPFEKVADTPPAAGSLRTRSRHCGSRPRDASSAPRSRAFTSTKRGRPLPAASG